MTELAGALTSRLRALWGTAVTVSAVRPMPGGASRESWDIEIHPPGQAQRHLILLRDVGGRKRQPVTNLEIEAAAMIARRAAGLPGAGPYDHREGARGQAYLPMARRDGEA